MLLGEGYRQVVGVPHGPSLHARQPRSRVASVLPASSAGESCFETSGVGRSVIPVEAVRVQVSQIQHTPRFGSGTQMGVDVETVVTAQVSGLAE